MKRKIWIPAAALLLAAGIFALLYFTDDRLVRDKDVFGSFVLTEGPEFPDSLHRLDITEYIGAEWLKEKSREFILLQTEEDRDILIEWISNTATVKKNNPEAYDRLLEEIRTRITEKTLRSRSFVVFLSEVSFANWFYTEAEKTSTEGELRLTVTEVGEVDSADWGPFYSLIIVGVSKKEMPEITSLTVERRQVKQKTGEYDEERWAGFPWYYAQDELFKGYDIAKLQRIY